MLLRIRLLPMYIFLFQLIYVCMPFFYVVKFEHKVNEKKRKGREIGREADRKRERRGVRKLHINRVTYITVSTKQRKISTMMFVIVYFTRLCKAKVYSVSSHSQSNIFGENLQGSTSKEKRGSSN